jgi:hypothetical protein
MTLPNLDSASVVVGEYQWNHFCYYPDSIEDFMGEMQLAPNGKIYISPAQWAPCMDVINYPNVKDSACGFVQNAFPLYNTLYVSTSFSALPNQPNYELGSFVGSACDTLNNLNNLSSNLLIKIFPNPVNDIINVEVLNGIAPDNISVIDVTGRVWEQFKPRQPNSQLSIAALPQGVYFVQVKTAARIMVGKVVKE